MGLIFAERIIKRYYHNGPVIQSARTQRSQPSHVCFTKKEGGRNEGGEKGINMFRKSKRNRERKKEVVRRRQTAKKNRQTELEGVGEFGISLTLLPTFPFSLFLNPSPPLFFLLSFLLSLLP